MTTATDARLARLLTMVPWLQANPGVAWAEVTARFGLTEDELVGDLQLLDNCSLPGGDYLDMVEISYEGDRITVTQPQSLDRPLQLTAEEGVALLAAGQALADLPGGGSPDLASALVKVGALVGQTTPTRPAPAEDPIGDAVRQALEQGRQLRLCHRSESRDAESERVVSPVELLLRQGTAYLEATCHTSDGQRLFRLDRIVAAELLDTPADPGPVRLDVDEQGFVRRGGQPVAVVDLDRSARWAVEDLPLTVVQERPDGSVRVEVAVADRTWLLRLLLRLGGRGRVVSPPELAAELAALARAGLSATAD